MFFAVVEIAGNGRQIIVRRTPEECQVHCDKCHPVFGAYPIPAEQQILFRGECAHYMGIPDWEWQMNTKFFVEFLMTEGWQLGEKTAGKSYSEERQTPPYPMDEWQNLLLQKEKDSRLQQAIGINVVDAFYACKKHAFELYRTLNSFWLTPMAVIPKMYDNKLRGQGMLAAP